MQYTTTGSSETRTLGQHIASECKGGDTLLLEGNLGAGKTTLVKGIAEGLGIPLPVVSPTFTLLNMYPVAGNTRGIQQLIHIDTYRLETEDQLRAIGAEDYIGDEHTLTIIEWPEKLAKLLQGKKTKTIILKHASGDERSITIH
ncbi:MAG TPA: tRNA (adenosine(37)-N6)-threonylcarbamoyltransferase complex ATPase subunit type 1 TsaE [Candidatus Kapabacteria bacterium]|nr:tRNA (adenosine(37)-N6)-threonylcarbamoyltransferase complex ATPase subunit type 1 TsaE [Candidatus Kapabacteria bacterium]